MPWATFTLRLCKCSYLAKRSFAILSAKERTLDEQSGYIIAPDPSHTRLTRRVVGFDQTGAEVAQDVIEERPLTIYLNAQEIVTAMTIGDYPEYLALGFLRNQGMLEGAGAITRIEYDAELEVVVVRTDGPTNHEEKLKKKTRTSGCAVGTVFGDMMEGLEGVILPQAELRTSWLYELARKINTTPSLYLNAGAIHGTVLCKGDQPLVYMEDVGRHNAVDKIAGWMMQEQASSADKILYTTGRLTSEMVIKCAHMGIPALVSRSGFTAWGVELAQQVGLTLIGRMRGKRFQCLAGAERITWDADLAQIKDEPKKSGRKGSA
jgi:FdhD protein